MLFAEKEINLIDAFRGLSRSEIALIPTNGMVESICLSLQDEARWETWTDSSAKDAPPPDFYSTHEKLMMEVMRVDDHGFKRKGKIVNPTLAREHEIERELRESGALGLFPDSVMLMINEDSGLPTTEDHNYQYYFENFKRTIEHHKSKINKYRDNHPGYKTVFFVHDESTAYAVVKKVPNKIQQGGIVRGMPHFWFFDRRFIDIFKDTSIDYLIWMAPYKLFQTVGRSPLLPTACVFDCHNIDIELMDYDMSHMVSSEV